jgi:sarcosine oxidase gamma subunit
MRPDPAEEFSRRFAAAKAADNVRAFVAGYAALGDAQRQVRRVAAALDDLWTVIDPAGMDADDVADLFELEERIARMAALVERDLRQREAARDRKKRGTDRHGRDLRRPRPDA